MEWERKVIMEFEKVKQLLNNHRMDITPSLRDISTSWIFDAMCRGLQDRMV